MARSHSSSPDLRETGTATLDSVDALRKSRPYDPVLFSLAFVTTLATFPMIFMGGLVTSHHAGMSVPDWPNSYHYNMFLFPPRLWIGGIFYEHTHRLMGTVVGFFSVLLAAYAWRGLIVKVRPAGSTPPLVRWTCLAVFLAVVLQGVIGGLRVVFVNLDLAIVHACLAQAFFCLAAFSTIIASSWWTRLSQRDPIPRDRVLIGLGMLSVIVIFLQLFVGATMRHFDAGLAIPDLPRAYGHWLPPVSSEALDTINSTRIWKLNLEPVTLQQIWLAYGHRVGALIVSLLLLALTLHVFYHHRRETALVRLSVAICALLATQLTLGVLTVILRKPADVASLHVATGALVLACTFVLTVCVMGLMPRGRRELRDASTDVLATGNASRDTVPAWT